MEKKYLEYAKEYAEKASQLIETLDDKEKFSAYINLSQIMINLAAFEGQKFAPKQQLTEIPVPTKEDLENKPAMKAMNQASENIVKVMQNAAEKAEAESKEPEETVTKEEAEAVKERPRTIVISEAPTVLKRTSIETDPNAKLTVDQLDDTWTDRMLNNIELKTFHDKLYQFIGVGIKRKFFTPQWVNERIGEVTEGKVQLSAGVKFDDVIVPKNVKLIYAHCVKAWQDLKQNSAA